MAALDASLRTATPDVAAGEAGPADTAAHAKPPRRASGFDRHVVSVLGLPFDICTVAEAVERLRADALSNTRCWVSTPNLNFLIAAQSDAAFRDSVLRSDLSLADGAPIVRIARFLGLPLHERVAGATVFEALRAHPGTPLSVYFFGGP
jgi:N-acetylglucosaminyldiphosphoundecaprenol N-acetyl-beta-D-mannosaminyltransferase